MEDLETALWMRIGRRMGAHRPHVYASATEQCQALEPNTSVSFSGDEDGTTWYHVYRYETWNAHPTIHMVVARDADRYVTYDYVGPFAEEAEDAMHAIATPNTFTLFSVGGHTEISSVAGVYEHSGPARRAEISSVAGPARASGRVLDSQWTWESGDDPFLWEAQRTMGYHSRTDILPADEPVYILCSDWALTNTVTLHGVFSWDGLQEELLTTTVHDEENPLSAEESSNALSHIRDGMTVRFRGADLYYFVTRVPASPLNGQLHIASVKDTMSLGNVEILYAYTSEQLHVAIQEYCLADPTTVARGVVNDIIILQ
jgi:hypothetical protein